MSKVTVRNLIISITLLFIAVGSFFYMAYEVNNKNKILEQQITALHNKEAQESTFFKMKRTAEDSAEDRAELAGYFFNQESDSIDFLNLIEELAPQSSVTLEVEGLEQMTDKKTQASWVLVTFNFNGEHDDVIAFVNVLENLPYLSEITDLALAARSSNNWEADVTMKINVYAYDE